MRLGAQLLVVLLLFDLRSPPAQADVFGFTVRWGAKHLENPLLREVGEMIISNRCGEVFNPVDLKAQYMCGIAAHHLFETINPHINVDRKALMFFYSRYKNWYNWPDLPNYLSSVRKGLDDVRNGKASFYDLYAFTVSYNKSAAKADELLAVLFQDNERQLQLPFLEIEAPFNDHPAISRLISSIQRDISNTGPNPSLINQVRLFPAEIEEHRDQFLGRAYYVWIPAFLTQESESILKTYFPEDDSQVLRKQVARAVALLLCMTFKFSHIYGSVPQALLQGFSPTVYRSGDPVVESVYKDLYMASLAIMEVTGEKSPFLALPFEKFRSGFASNPWNVARKIVFAR